MMLTVLALSGIVTIGIVVIKTSRSYFWKFVWGIIVVALLLLLLLPV